ncbi:MAG TPA: S8 family peptidase, partial [Blastocatellia bacterium]|nr:S8 family peptidase [Blastocatellia bacterium]
MKLVALLPAVWLCVLTAQAQTQWAIQLPAEQQASSGVSVQNLCLATHEFALGKSAELTWLTFVREPRLRIAQGATNAADVRIDTRGLDVGIYTGLITVRCADCGAEPGCQPQNIQVQMKVLWPRAQLDRLPPPQYLPRQVLVELRLTQANALRDLVRRLETRYGLRQLKLATLPTIGRATASFLLLNPNVGVAQAVEQIQQDAEVLGTQPNFVYQTFTPQLPHNDPLAALQYAPPKINADQLHPQATGRGIKIAVVDTGIDYEHVELKGRVTARANFVEGDKNFASDVHGTLVAGVIAAQPNNKTGIYGIAPEAELIAIKAFQPRHKTSIAADGSSQSVAQGLDFAITNQARIINLSLGGPKEPLLAQLVQTAHARGIVLVAAAGNDGLKGEPKYPAAYAEVIAVSATNNKDELYTAATRGTYIDLVAPGVEVMSTVPDNKFNSFTGTSMAAPHV